MRQVGKSPFLGAAALLGELGIGRWTQITPNASCSLSLPLIPSGARRLAFLTYIFSGRLYRGSSRSPSQTPFSSFICRPPSLVSGQGRVQLSPCVPFPRGCLAHTPVPGGRSGPRFCNRSSVVTNIGIRQITFSRESWATMKTKQNKPTSSTIWVSFGFCSW